MNTISENILTGGVWTYASVTDRPEMVLTNWAVFELQLPGNPGRTLHFAGYNDANREGGISSAIVEFDPSTWRGETESGRVCGLRGMPGLSADGENVWRKWLSVNCGVDAVNVTNELLVQMVP